MPIVRRGIHTLVPLLTDLDTTNVLERIEQAVKGLEEAKSLKYGKDAWLIYGEFRRLFNMGTISDIAQYQCSLTAGQFSPTNKHAHMVLPLLSKLSSITRLLKIYLRRASINDRLSSLLEAINAIDKMSKLVDHDYAMPLRDGVLVGESMANLPDRHFFDLLLKSWKDVVEAQFDELRGKAELEATLRTKCAHQEEQVGVLLSVSNKGRSSADEVKVTLLHSHNFDVVSQRSFETETVFPGEEVPFEFIIRPHTTSLDLIFEIYYNDVDMTEQTLSLRDRLELQPSLSAFKWISNPYSTGTPTHGSEMFYGRDDDIKFLKDNLTRSPAKTVIVLHGLRRSGKTTLLLHLVNTSVLEPHIPVFIDMQHESYHISISKFFYKVAFYIFQALRQKGILICQPAIKDFEVDPTFTFDLFLNGVEAQLNGEKIIMLIDEFEVLEEQVKKGNLQPEFFEYLRSLMQHRQSLNFLLSGTHKIEQLTKGYWSVFFNIALHYRLSKLSEMGATDLISKPVEGYLEYDPYALAKIRRLTGDQPYLIHLMCRSLVDYCNEKRKAYVTINDVNTVLHEVMQTGQFHFGWLWDQITQHERVVLAVIVEGGKDEGRLLSLVEIEDIFRYYRYPYKHDLVLESLTSLKNLDVIESVSDDGRESVFDGTRYRIAVGLIRRWLQRKAAGVCDARCEISR